MRETKSICCYCGVGCGVIIASDDARIAGVRGDPEHPANFGKLCTKGATLHLTARRDTRALYPEQREARGLARSRVTWDEALDRIAVKFAGLIRAHGPDSVAFYISGQLLTEDYYVFNKLAKGLIGTNNVDTNSRLCMSSAASGYKASLGADAPPACYEDIDHAGCVFIAGSNAAYAHPVLFGRIEDAKARNPALKLIVVDPRRTDTAAMADLHLPILPGSDIALYNAMLHVLLWEGLVDDEYIRAHTTGFDALKEIAREYTPAAAAELCGVPAEDIVRAAKWFGACTPTLSLYCQGLNQSVHGTHNNAALINLLALDPPESTMHYCDLRRGVFKAARVEGDAVIAVRLVGETAGEEWLKNMMVQGASAEAVRPWVLAPVSTPPRGTLNRGRVVCNCLDVSETEIRRELASGVTLAGLQAKLKCGTECGSCMPELKKMRAAQERIDSTVAVHAAPQ